MLNTFDRKFQTLKKTKQVLLCKSQKTTGKLKKIQLKTICDIDGILNFFEVVGVKTGRKKSSNLTCGTEIEAEYRQEMNGKIILSRQKKFFENVKGFKSLGINNYTYMSLCAKSRRIFKFKPELIDCFLEFGFTRDQIRKYILKYPRICVSNPQTISRNMYALNNIISKIGLDKDNAIRQILIYPSIFTSSAKTLFTNYEIRKQTFIDRFGFDEEGYKDYLSKLIIILILSEGKFNSKIEFFKKRGFNKNQIKLFLSYISNFFTRSAETFQNSCDILKKFDYTDNQINEIIAGFSNVLVASNKKLNSFLTILKKRNGLSLFFDYPILFYFYTENGGIDRFYKILEGLEKSDITILNLVEDMRRKFSIK